MTSTSQTIKKKDSLSCRPSNGKGKRIRAHELARTREKEKGLPSLPFARPKIPFRFPTAQAKEKLANVWEH